MVAKLLVYVAIVMTECCSVAVIIGCCNKLPIIVELLVSIVIVMTECCSVAALQ